jgi:hypothetical protein
MQNVLAKLEGSLGIRHREHTRYIKTNNPISAYALHMLNNKHEYGNAGHTIQPLKSCTIGNKMNFRGSFYIHIFQQQNSLIDEENVKDLKPIYNLASATRRHVM